MTDNGVKRTISADAELLGWSDNQGSILTGGGELAKRTSVGVDYAPEDLPHYLLSSRTTRKQFALWLTENRRDFGIVGAWSRPIFAGGWKESSSGDTEAFNLQTPSFFIDMRIPTHRPTDIFKTRGSISQCSDYELRLLARQHCFAGYSLPVQDVQQGGPMSFVRHHIIDWNYHPSFPRARPNRWWVTTDVSDQRAKHGSLAFASTFKEFSFARDEHGVPVYFERWARRAVDSGGDKYLALRRTAGCPIAAAKLGVAVKRDAVLVVVGNHFALAVDRPQPQPVLAGFPGPAGPAFVDYALMTKNRAAAIDFLDLEGSYGHIYPEGTANEGAVDVHNPSWRVVKSTHPWREGKGLLPSNEKVELQWKLPEKSIWGTAAQAPSELAGASWGGDEWEVMECSFSEAEVCTIFCAESRSKAIKARL